MKGDSYDQNYLCTHRFAYRRHAYCPFSDLNDRSAETACDFIAERGGMTNVRVANGDAIILLREMLPPASLDGLRVYFPDPWPKKRHNKRRLIQPEFLTLAAHSLKPGALVHCATDWEEYAEQMLEVLTAHPDYANTQDDGGFAPRPAFRPLTRLEGQGLDKGHVVHDLLFRRK